MFIGTLIIAIAASAIISGALVYYVFPPPVPEPEGVEEVLFGLDWFYSGYHMPYFVALDKGYYLDEGLSVTIVRGYGSGDTTKRVDVGSVDLGSADTGTVMIARSEGAKVKTVGMWHPHTMDTFVTFADSGIETPQDFEGKTFADIPGGSNYVTMPAFCEINGIDINKINIVAVDWGTRMGSFTSGQADFTTVAIYDLIQYEKAAQDMGKELHVIYKYQWGQDTYGHGIIASEDYMQSNPETIRKFLAASYRGLDYATTHKQETIDTMLKYVPELDREKLDDNYDRYMELQIGPELDLGKSGTEIGMMDKDRMEDQIELLADAMDFEPFPAEEQFTNEFLSD
jgi:ABC-type nitrate/sulfonate/bicarbonate transport system substrate-binding protein